MRPQTACSLIVIATIFMQSCIPASTDEIVKIEKPDKTIISDFGLKINGQIIYEFYQKYGFTDLEEHLILIVKPDKTDFLISNSLDIKKMQKIDTRKFIKNKPINFSTEKTIQADIRIESKEFDSGQDKTIYYNPDNYRLTMNDSLETIYIFDNTTGLMYVESKKEELTSR